MKTPYFLISEEKLCENIYAFKSALKLLWPNSRLGYSVKTNSLPWLLKYLRKHDIVAEVVSDEEYRLALLCGYSDEDIIFNGPIKGESQFAHAVRNGATVNLDSLSDLTHLCQYCTDPHNTIGIRVNVPPEAFNPSDIDYMKDGFRFGFSVENGAFSRVLELIRDQYGKDVHIGLHLHCNSITRSLDVYKSVSIYAANLINKYNLVPSFIDMGGGYFGGVPGKATPLDYLTTIHSILSKVVDTSKTALLLEPGSAIIGSVVDFHTSVLDCKDTDHARIVTTDGSRIHIDPLWSKSGYSYTLCTKNSKANIVSPRQIICGYTCMDHDRLMVLENQPELSPGDEIVYHRIGAYSMTFGGMFIRYYPEVYVQENGLIKMVRSRISPENYLEINS